MTLRSRQANTKVPTSGGDRRARADRFRHARRRVSRNSGSDGDVWAYLVRPASAPDLMRELGPASRRIADGVVVAPRAAGAVEPIVPVFAQQRMRTDGIVQAADVEVISEKLVRLLLRRAAGSTSVRFALEVTDAGRDAGVTPFAEALRSRLLKQENLQWVSHMRDAEWIAQVWMVSEDRAVVGVTTAAETLSHHPGGRWVQEGSAQGLAARTWLETFDWIKMTPERADACVVLAHPKRRVEAGIASLVARISPVAGSPFQFVPHDTVDWLVIALFRSPVEVANLAAKWGRRAWARQLAMKVRLPTSDKSGALRVVMETLKAAGWRGLRARQLSLDTDDEVTIFAWLDPAALVRGMRAPFRPRKRDARTVASVRREERERQNERATPRRGEAARGRVRPSDRGAAPRARPGPGRPKGTQNRRRSRM